jgi:hypothetical protein
VTCAVTESNAPNVAVDAERVSVRDEAEATVDRNVDADPSSFNYFLGPEGWISLILLVGAGRFERRTPCAQVKE